MGHFAELFVFKGLLPIRFARFASVPIVAPADLLGRVDDPASGVSDAAHRSRKPAVAANSEK